MYIYNIVSNHRNVSLSNEIRYFRCTFNKNYESKACESFFPHLECVNTSKKKYIWKVLFSKFII